MASLTLPQNIFNIIYPVDSIYITVGESPQSIFSKLGIASTWEKIEGRFLLGSSSSNAEYKINNIGGEEKHLLTIDELPPHTHTYREAYVTGADGDWGSGGLPDEIRTSNTGSAGGNEAHNNMPPYYVVDIYKRIS